MKIQREKKKIGESKNQENPTFTSLPRRRRRNEASRKKNGSRRDQNDEGGGSLQQLLK